MSHHMCPRVTVQNKQFVHENWQNVMGNLPKKYIRQVPHSCVCFTFAKVVFKLDLQFEVILKSRLFLFFPPKIFL